MLSDDYYITIFGWMHERLDLSVHEEKVYALIYGFSNNGENTCNTSQKTMSRMCNCGLNTVKRAINTLEQRGLIKSRDVIRGGVKYKEYWVTDECKNNVQDIKKDVRKSKSKTKSTNRFNNFNGREYTKEDFNELEKSFFN